MQTRPFVFLLHIFILLLDLQSKLCECLLENGVQHPQLKQQSSLKLMVYKNCIAKNKDRKNPKKNSHDTIDFYISMP